MSEPVAICVDFKSPHAYLAVAPTRALEARLGVAFDWRPLIVPPLPRPRPAGPGDDRGARHRRLRAEYVANDLLRYAGARGLALRDPYRAPDTTLASIGLLWLRKTAPEHAADYVEAVFDLLWQHDADLSDRNVVERALGARAGDFSSYCEADGPRELEASQRELTERGVWNVPAYLVAGEVLLGRAHLPFVAWVATDRRGEPPL